MNGIEALRGIDEGPRDLMVSSEKSTEPSSGPVEGTPETATSAWTAGPHVLVTVRDTGPGLDPQGLERLFEAFYTTKPQGLGMGLAISRSIIQAHGGRLWAGTNAPQGAPSPCRSAMREAIIDRGEILNPVTQYYLHSTKRSQRQKNSHAKTQREDGFGTRVNRGNGDLCCLPWLLFKISVRGKSSLT